MKRILYIIFLAHIGILASNAATGKLFHVAATGMPGDVSISLCLNAYGPLTCQNHTVSALNLTINTVPIGHYYPAAGIRVNTPGYIVADLGIACTPLNNGYCLFAVSDTTASNISILSNLGFFVNALISGLANNASISLQDGADSVKLGSNGVYTFPSILQEGSYYNVVALTQPTGQFCAISNGGPGFIAGDNVLATVACSSNPYSVSAAVLGLNSGNTLVLTNATDSLSYTSNIIQIFPTALTQGASYAVTVASQPSDQRCTVNNGVGSINGSDVAATVNCSSENSLTATVSGLAGTLVLQNNATDYLTIVNTSGGSLTSSFQPNIPYTDGSSYSVTIYSSPTGQTCLFANGTTTTTGTIGDYATVDVTCTSSSYTVGGTLIFHSGYTGPVQIQNNSGSTLTITNPSGGSFTFATSVPQGGSYAVSVLSEPADQTCSVANGAGTIQGNNVTDVVVTCSIPTYTLGGTVIGLATGNTLVLQSNNSDNLAINTNGPFTFATPIAQASPYSITVQSQPYAGATNNQICTVNNGSGSSIFANENSATVTCESIVQPNFLYVASSFTGAYQCDIINGAVSNCILTPTDGSGTWNNPSDVALATVNGVQYAYVSDGYDPSQPGNVFQCSLNSDGSFANCALTPTDGSASTTWVPYGVTVATVNTSQYGYVVDNTGFVYWCGVNSLGNFINCAQTPTDGSVVWNGPYQLTIATVNGVQYAYVADNGGAAVYKCLVDTSTAVGDLTNCVLTPTTGQPWNAPSGLTVATAWDGRQIVYVSNNKGNNLYVCSLSAIDGAILSDTCVASPNGASTPINFNPYGIAISPAINEIQTAYVAGFFIFNIAECSLNTDGTASVCPTTTANIPFWTPRGLVLGYVAP